MERLSASDYAVVVGYLDELYRARDAASFSGWLIRSLGGLVGTNLTTWNRMLPMVPRVEARPYPEVDDHDRIMDVFQRRLLEHPCIRHHVRTGSPEPTMISDFISSSRFHGLGLYDEVYRALDIEEQIGFFFGRYGGETLAVALCRDRRTFGERERALLATLRPHIARAYDNARVVDRCRRQQSDGTSPEAAAHCLLSLDEWGRPRELPPAAARWLGEHFGDHRSLARGALPADVLRWLRALGPVGSDVLVHHQGEKRLMVRRLLEPGAPRAVTVLLLERHTLAGGGAHLRGRGLTRREIEVLCILEQGLTNEEIAARLPASPLTVKKHLERIYRKLGVRNRTEAVAKLRDGRQS